MLLILKITLTSEFFCPSFLLREAQDSLGIKSQNIVNKLWKRGGWEDVAAPCATFRMWVRRGAGQPKGITQIAEQQVGGALYSLCFVGRVCLAGGEKTVHSAPSGWK